MSDRSKYSLNGVYRCENFAEHIENANFPLVPIGSALGLNGWYIKFRRSIENGRTFVYPFIHNDDREDTIQIRVFFNFIKKGGSSLFEFDPEPLYLDWYDGCMGENVDIEELLGEENGYLEDGAITVEYGVQVESVEGEDGIWEFNFFDRFFDWRNQDTMTYFYQYERPFFGHKQIVKLHSKTIHDCKSWIWMPKSFDPHYFVMCLQITHGVRLQLSAKEIETVIDIAFHFGFTNTIRYCEGKLIEMDEHPEFKMIWKFIMAIKYNLERYMIHLLIHTVSAEKLACILNVLDLEGISSESMKAIVAKIFSF